MDRGSAEQQSLHLLEEIIEEEILSRLPVKSLLRFRCVSKAWRSLIDTKRFVKAQLQNSRKNRGFPYHMAIFKKNGDAIKQCSLPPLLNELSNIPCPIYDPTMKAVLVGCHNGLFCCVSVRKDKQMDFSLWNPATRISMELPQTGHVWEDGFAKCGFGWDEASGAYKVFAFMPSALDYRIGVGKLYSSKTNSWKTVEHGCLDLYDLTAVCACGKLYWPTESEIEWFDLESEEFGRMELPFDDEAQYYTLVEVEEKEKEKAGLHLLCKDESDFYHSRVDVWVMNKDKCWSKLVSLPLVYDDSSTVELLCLGPNGEILIIFFGNLIVYDPRDNLLRTAKNTIAFPRGFVYVESLVSPLNLIHC